MTENEKLRALLAEARPILWLHRPSGDADCDCSECRAIVAVVARIDAALAEPMKSSALPPMTDLEVALLYGHQSFTGPCVHGRDPWDRCDDCGEGSAVEAAVLVLHQTQRERDEARAEVKRLKHNWKWDAIKAYKRGAEAMREAAAVRVDGEGINVGPHFASIVRDLPIPEDKP